MRGTEKEQLLLYTPRNREEDDSEEREGAIYRYNAVFLAFTYNTVVDNLAVWRTVNSQVFLRD